MILYIILLLILIIYYFSILHNKLGSGNNLHSNNSNFPIYKYIYPKPNNVKTTYISNKNQIIHNRNLIL
jgi:hypothetical protein